MLSGATSLFEAGIADLRAEFDIPDGFPGDVVAEARTVAGRGVGGATSSRVDRTDMDFVTLDPEGSTDLDQAFAIEMGGDDVLLHYAIADVGFFVRSGGAIDSEAWRRGVTVYLPGDRAGLHPPVLAEGAASLLAGGPRPAVVFTVRIASDGKVRLDGVERAIVRSRAQLAYATVTADDLPTGFDELARRIEFDEQVRGAERIESPEQEVVPVDGRLMLRFRPKRKIEVQGAALSLATNLAVADALLAAGTGLFRTMARLDERGVRRLRHTARAFGLDWPSDMPLARFERSLEPDAARTGAFLLAVRRASGAASYTPYVEGELPWHSAVAATYCHATAPLRRLADRFVVEAAVGVANGRDVPDWVSAAFTELPATMQRATSRARQIDRAALDLAEAVVLAGREGDTFDAVVTDEDDRGVRLQIGEPAIVARVSAHRVDPGDDIRVKLTKVDIATRTVEFVRIG